ncbi:MAG TPA: tetratricopeptide repeat protein [Xanthomonadales bacterium]
MSLFNELKRRNVFKVAIAYIVVAWLVMQVADVVLNNITAPDWVFKVLMLFLAMGLPFAVIFAWAFEMTPEGLKRESEVDRSQSITHVTSRKLNNLITGALVLALAYFAYDKFVLSADRNAALVEATTQAVSENSGSVAQVPAKAENSIAVLPFVNMSSDAEQEYFSDGLSEELLNLLAKIPELKVASRSSAFQFKGEKFDLKDVAQKLDVAHVLEGSVRKAGNQVRITAQLIKAEDGYHMWSETYDRSLDNIFAIQDEIAAAVVEALKIELLGEAPKAKVVDPEAYALWLKGRYVYAKWGKENFEKAIEAFNQALMIDPDYVDAWASLSVAYLTQTTSGYRNRDEGLVLARAAIDKALLLNPDLPTVLARLSLIQSIFEWDWQSAETTIQKALALAPEDPRVLGAAGNLFSATGPLEKALDYYQQTLKVEPLDLVTLYNVGDVLFRQGRLEEAKSAYRRLLELNPEDWGTHTQLAIILLKQERLDEAWAELELEVDPQQQEIGRMLVLPALGREVEAQQKLDIFIQENQSWAAYPIATIYAWHGDSEAAFTWLERAYQQHDSLMSTIAFDPLLTSLHGDPRWAELLDRLGLPHQ